MIPLVRRIVMLVVPVIALMPQFRINETNYYFADSAVRTISKCRTISSAWKLSMAARRSRSIALFRNVPTIFSSRSSSTDRADLRRISNITSRPQRNAGGKEEQLRAPRISPRLHERLCSCILH